MLFILTLYGCQTHIWHPLSREAAKTTLQQKKAHNLLVQGKHINALNQPEKDIECKRLKHLYQSDPDWKTAWLLAFSFNNKSNCISLVRKIYLLQSMHSSENPSTELHWLNIDHLKLLIELNKLKKQQGINNSLRTQLKDTQTQLMKENSKIEALKKIETSINKKLDNE